MDITGIVTRLGLEIGLQRYFGETHTARDRGPRIAVLRRLRLLASTLALLPVVAVALGLGILGEYLGRIYSETKGRPIYIVRDRFDDAA